MPNRIHIGVCALAAPAKNAPRTVQYSEYVHEMLGHAGLCCDPVAPGDLAARLDSLRVLVTVGEQRFDDALRARLTAWVTDEGGAWLSVGGLCGMEELLGADYAPASFALWGGSLRALGEGFLDGGQSEHPVLRDLSPIPLHYFSGVAATARPGAQVLASCLDAHHRPVEGRPALIENRAGRGRCLLIAPDVTGSVVRIQQGTAITRDGVPSPDGTGPVSDGVLKSDDGQALDWLLDRQPVPGVPGLSGFLQPVADQWRDLLLRSILHLASEQGVPVSLLWYHPDNLPAVGHISHDSDGNGVDQAWGLLKTLERAEIRSTWCVILPGYSPDIIAAIRDAGHELATHYDSVTEGLEEFSEAQFDRQWRLLCEQFGDEKPVTNKNHYLRWEGDVEFFQWCIARGIRLDQTKGTSKSGEVGFNFGTCHPYRPTAPGGDVLPIHELPTPTQDLRVFAPEEVVPAMLESVARHYGVLHLLFHPAHIDKPGVADSIVTAVRLGREKGLAWRTAREIVEWEEARRAAAWEGAANGVSLKTPQPLKGATLLCLAPKSGGVRVNGADPASTERRWGFTFHAATLDLAAGAAATIEFIEETTA